MPGDYGYANARLRAMKSRLLTRADYEALLARPGVNDLIISFTDTVYGEDIESAMLHYSGVHCITEALRRNVARTFQRIRGFFEDGEPQRLVEILLGRWDLHNVKTVIRGQVVQAPSSQILEAIVPAGQLDTMALESLAQQPGLQAAVDLMMTQRLPLAHIVSAALRLGPGQALRVYDSREDLPALELAIDREYYAQVMAYLRDGSENVALVRDMVQAEIDMTNLTTLFRLRHGRPPGESLTHVLPAWLIEGGALSEGRWRRLAEVTSVDDLTSALEGTPYHGSVERGIAEGMLGAQRALEWWLARRGIAHLRGDPLSIAIAIGYTWAKTTEVINLRIIAYGLVERFAKDTIRQDLMLP
jgi:V/A-type H+-transporting ATPase subunit C